MITIAAFVLLVVFAVIVGVMAIAPMVIEAETRQPAPERRPVSLGTAELRHRIDERQAA